MSKGKDKDLTMEQLLGNTKQVRRGQMVKGTVFQVEDNVIYVTLENNQEARMYIEYYGKSIESFDGVVNVDDTIHAIVSKIEDRDDATYVLLDRKRIVSHENLEKVEELYKNEEIYEAKITRVDKAGLHLDVHGFSAFLPYGLLDYELEKIKNELKGTMLKVHIIEVKPGRKPRIIASRKKIFEEARLKERERIQQQREEEFDNINTGDIVKGKVERIQNHMALIRFEHVVGRLRISQISHTRIEDINDVLKVGQEVEVKVIKKDNKSLDLSMKELIPTPLQLFVKENKVGDTVVGKVVQKLRFGIILELAEKVRGLLHKSEYSWNPDDNFDSFVKPEDKVETVITLIDEKKNKISLSRRLLLDNPWKNVHFNRGEIVECEIEEVSEEGLLIKTKGVNGFIPARELAEERVEDPTRLFAVGDKLRATVTSVNPKNWHLRLSIKQLIIQEEKAQYEQHMTEEEISGQSVGELLGEVLGEDTEEE